MARLLPFPATPMAASLTLMTTLRGTGLSSGQDQDVVGGGFAANESWAGAMDNLRIYNRALSASEAGRVANEAR